MTWLAPAQILKLKTHCVRGHAYTEENTYRKDDGYRRCRECRRLDMMNHRRRAKGMAA